MSFFGLQIQPCKAYRIEIPKGKRLHLTAACVAPQNPTPTALNLSVDSKTHIIACVGAGSQLMTNLDLAFGHGQSISFSVTGEKEIHLTGYFEVDADMYFNEEMTQREFEESFDGEEEGVMDPEEIEEIEKELEALRAMKEMSKNGASGKRKRKREDLEADDAAAAQIEGLGADEEDVGEPKKKKKKKKKKAAKSE